jgi:hypothetical protein
MRSLATRAAYVEVSVINTPSNGRHIRPRASAQAELEALLGEIPQWSDEVLLHMHRRFGESRLFRVHHAPDGQLTDRTRILLHATRAEMILRGLGDEADEQ